MKRPQARQVEWGAGYEYINARLRAMRSRLLPPASLEQLLAAPNLESLIGQLNQTTYQDALERSLATASGLPAILRAVRVYHGQVLRRIIAFGGNTIAAPLTVLLAPYQRQTIITLLRGVSGGHAPDRILAWAFDLPPFHEGVLRELARQVTVADLVDLLAQWQLPSPELAASLVAVRPINGDLRQLTSAFDEAWANSVSQQAAALGGPDGKLVQLDLGRLIDLHNLLAALNLAQAELARPPSWLPGGYLTSGTLEQVRMASTAQAIDEALAGALRGGELWRGTPDRPLAGLQWDEGQESSLQLFWENTLLNWRVSLFATADPLGVGVLIAFLAAQGAEVRNLRLVAEAVAGNVDPEDVRRHYLLAEA